MEHVKPTFDRAIAIKNLTEIIQTGDCRAIYRAILFSTHLFEDLASIPLEKNELKTFQTQYRFFLDSVQNTPLIGSVEAFDGKGLSSIHLVLDALRALDLSFLLREEELRTSRVILNTFTFDAHTHEIWNRKRKRISLPEKLSAIFSTLLYKRGIPVTFEELDPLWNRTRDTSHNLEQAMTSLRDLLDTLHCGIKIRSLYNVGYLLEV